ncbi:unnamed protein product [Linum tenue]|uniref:Uncharacterized protein n=1 Tax=Linum tenue TaxID=586396 RepID=A0AAV0QKL5_9ROSI|nr:unnamed protein product [Linum tenue]
MSPRFPDSALSSTYSIRHPIRRPSITKIVVFFL